MALDLKISVKRQIDRLKKELDVATARLAAVRDEIERHELIYDMLDGRTNTASTASRAGQPRGARGGMQKRGPRGSMIDWNAVFATLPVEFTLDTITANKTASEKPRAYLRQVVVRWSKEGRIARTGRGVYRKT